MQRRDFLTAAGLMAATAGARRAGWAWTHPRLAIPPGGRYENRFTVDQGAGLSWYHPHTHVNISRR